MPGHRDGRDRGLRWRKIRLMVLERDEYRCQIKIADCCTTIGTQAHHTLGWAITGDNPQHLVAACMACNLRIGEPSGPDPEPRRDRRW